MSAASTFRVRVPCSTSNLGSGFDTLGLALDRYLHVSWEPGGSELEVERTGTVADADDLGEDVLLRTFLSEVTGGSGAAPHGILRVHSEIPVARGLGSSAAALVAGHDLARAVRGVSQDPVRSFRYAAGVEGHGDNAAPCALGGLRAVVPGEDGPRPLALELSPELGFAYAAPAAGISTAEARASLPGQVPHGVAVAELGRLAALLRGLALADEELIRVGVEDELHVPHRLPLIPGAYAAIAAGYEAGAWAVTISGSGSGLFAVTAQDDAPVVAAAMREVFTAGGPGTGCLGFSLRPDFEGLTRPE